MPQLKVWNGIAWEYVSKGEKGDTGSMYIDQSGGTSDTYGALTGSVNGSNTIFTVSQAKYTTGSLTVYLNGQLQTQGTAEDWHEASPTTGIFHFETAPETGDLITAVYSTTGAGGWLNASFEDLSSQIDGSETVFALGQTPVGDVSVFYNGLRQQESAFSIAGSTLTLTFTPVSGSNLYIEYYAEISSLSFVYNEVPAGTVDGTNDDFVFDNTPATGTLQVFRNGLLQKITEDYTLSGATVTFVTPPAVSSIILGSYQLSVTPAGNADTLDGMHAGDLILASQIFN